MTSSTSLFCTLSTVKKKIGMILICEGHEIVWAKLLMHFFAQNIKISFAESES